MSNEEAKKILDSLAKKCGYVAIELKYANGALKWHAYAKTWTNNYSILYEDNGAHCKCINVIGSGHSYAECLKHILESTSNGSDIKIDNLNLPFGENDEVLLKKGMTEDMLLIENDLFNLNFS